MCSLFFFDRTVKQINLGKCSCLFVLLYLKKLVVVINFKQQSLTSMGNFSEVAAWILVTFKCTINIILSIILPSKPIYNYRNLFFVNKLLQARFTSVLSFRLWRGEKIIGQCLKKRSFALFCDWLILENEIRNFWFCFRFLNHKPVGVCRNYFQPCLCTIRLD